MFSNRFRLIVPAILGLATLIAGSSTKAGFILDHAYTRAQASIGGEGGGPPVSADEQSGPLGASSFASTAGAASSDPSAAFTASSSGRVDYLPLGPGPTFSLHADALVTVSTYSGGGGAAYASARGEAKWEDLVFLSSYNTSLIGSTLRLSFSATGMTRREGGLAGQLSSADIGVNLRGSSYDQSTGTATAQAYAAVARNQFIYDGWDQFGGSPDAFSGTVHVDIPIFGGSGYLGTGGIYYSVYLAAGDGLQNSYAPGEPTGGSVYVSDPVRFVSITLPDVGNVTPESLGVAITFDSGIASPNVRAVPEPASVVMLGTGALGLLGYNWRRGNRKGGNRKGGGQEKGQEKGTFKISQLTISPGGQEKGTFKISQLTISPGLPLFLRTGLPLGSGHPCSVRDRLVGC